MFREFLVTQYAPTQHGLFEAAYYVIDRLDRYYLPEESMLKAQLLDCLRFLTTTRDNANKFLDMSRVHYNESGGPKAPLLSHAKDVDCVRLLLNQKADVNAVVDTSYRTDGMTRLHECNLSYLRGEPDVLKLLLEYKADPWIKDKHGKTAYELGVHEYGEHKGKNAHPLCALFLKFAMGECPDPRLRPPRKITDDAKSSNLLLELSSHEGLWLHMLSFIMDHPSLCKLRQTCTQLNEATSLDSVYRAALLCNFDPFMKVRYPSMDKLSPGGARAGDVYQSIYLALNQVNGFNESKMDVECSSIRLFKELFEMGSLSPFMYSPPGIHEKRYLGGKQSISSLLEKCLACGSDTERNFPMEESGIISVETAKSIVPLVVTCANSERNCSYRIVIRLNLQRLSVEAMECAGRSCENNINPDVSDDDDDDEDPGTTCERCDKLYCQSCMQWCTRCEIDVCRDCSDYCEACSDSLCKNRHGIKWHSKRVILSNNEEGYSTCNLCEHLIIN